MDLLYGKARSVYFHYLAAAFGSALISSIYGLVAAGVVLLIVRCSGRLPGRKHSPTAKEGHPYTTGAVCGCPFFTAPTPQIAAGAGNRICVWVSAASGSRPGSAPFGRRSAPHIEWRSRWAAASGF